MIHHMKKKEGRTHVCRIFVYGLRIAAEYLRDGAVGVLCNHHFRTSTTANFAQGSIAAFGCYVVAECLNRWGVPVYLGVLPGMIVGVVIGLFIDLMVFRKGRHVGELGKQIITMGFVSLFYGGIPLVFGNPEFIPFESFYNTTKAGVESNVVLRVFGGEIVLTNMR